MSSLWLHRPAPCPQARARLFCFPYAGGSASVYRFWPQGLPKELEVCAIQLPGRANRLREPALTSIPALVEALVPALMPYLDRPFAFFGHSMGAVLAYEVTHELMKRAARIPVHLFVSGRRPPHMPDPDPPLHVLPDHEFVDEINRRYGAIPPEVLSESDLMELLLPSLRADIFALETHRPTLAQTLPCPISAFGGADDRHAPREHLEAWRTQSSVSFRVRTFPGDHFYIDLRRDEVLAEVTASLAPMLVHSPSKEAAA
jgi:medium-chain acyl-[acyl-carrier-protein] hydrolase